MANLSIKDLPDAIHRKLKAIAKADGRSLNSLIRDVLEAKVQEDAHRRAGRRRVAELRRLTATLPQMSSSVEIIREMREERERELWERSRPRS
jgi:plasmid stability protein